MPMAAITILMLAFLAQGPAILEVGKPIEGIIGVDSPVAHTPTLDASHDSAPAVGNEFQIVIAESGPYTIELRSFDFDAYLVITEWNGALLTEDDDGLFGAHARVVLNLEAGQKYTVQACALRGERGKFQLQLLAGAVAELSPEERLLAEGAEARARLAQIEKTLGKETAEYADAKDLMGLHYYFLGELRKAQAELEDVVAIREKVLGPEHPDTAASLNNLAILFTDQGNSEGARPLYERSLAIFEKALGPEHPKTAVALDNLAVLLRSQGNYEVAHPLLKRALAIREKALGPNHPDTALSLSNLAFLLQRQGADADARTLFHSALSRSLSYLDRELPSMSEAGSLQLLETSGNPADFLASLLKATPQSLMDSYSTYQEWKGKATRLQAVSVRLGQSSDSPVVRKKKGKIQVIAKKLSRLILIPMAEQADDHAMQIDALREERLRLERGLNRELGLDLILATHTIEEVQAGLPSNAVLVDFFVGEEVFAWIMKSSGPPVLISLGEQAALRKAQNAFLSATATRGGRRLDPSKTNPTTAYLTLLWKPLQEAIGDSKIIFISPDGFLCELPFGIMHHVDGSFLLEKHQFYYLSDPTSLAEKEDSNKVDEGSLFAVGGANYFQREEVDDLVSTGPTTRSRVGGAGARFLPLAQKCNLCANCMIISWSGRVQCSWLKAKLQPRSAFVPNYQGNATCILQLTVTLSRITCHRSC